MRTVAEFVNKRSDIAGPIALAEYTIFVAIERKAALGEACYAIA